MGASIWIKAIRGYLHFLCGSWLFLTCSRRVGITHQTRANWGADWPEGQWRRAASRAALLSNAPVRSSDGHPCGGWSLAYGFWGPTAIDGTWRGRRPGFILLSLGMLEGVSECQRLLTPAHFWCQLPTLYNYPVITVHTYETRYSRDIQVDFREKRRKKRQIIFFFFHWQVMNKRWMYWMYMLWTQISWS